MVHPPRLDYNADTSLWRVPLAIRLRPLTDEERETLEKRTRSRTDEARAVERARIVLLASEGLLVPAIAERLGLESAWVRVWIKRFNADGLSGLRDRPRSGRPATYSAEQVGEVIAASLTNPASLDLPFASWTMDRLQAYLNEKKGVAMKRSRISEILIAEGLRWRHEETWFGERVDPEFAEKRAPSAGCIPHLHQAA